MKLTPKQHVLLAEPQCTLDYYESIRAAGVPCWFIRHGIQGPAITGICISPRAAWKEAYASLLASFGKKAA